MRALFTTALIIIALTASAFAFLVANPVAPTDEPMARIDVSAPPADFEELQEQAVLKLRPPAEPVAAPAPPVAAQPPLEAAAPSAAIDPGEVIPGLAIEGFNEPTGSSQAEAKAAGAEASEAATPAKPKAKPEKAAKAQQKPKKPQPVTEPVVDAQQLDVDTLPGAGGTSGDDLLPDGFSADASEP